MTSRDSAAAEITPEVLLRAYACGIFPMAESADDPSLFWVEPEMRGVIPLDGFHVSSRLARTVRSDAFTVTVDTAFKAIIAGSVLMTIGSLIAGIPDPFAPVRLIRLLLVIALASVALVSMMFLLMVRMNDPLLPRALFGVLNTLLWFPSGAIYPQQAFPKWMRALATVDPFTYAVHALKSLLLKNTGFAAIWFDLVYLAVFSVVTMVLATLLFKRTLS